MSAQKKMPLSRALTGIEDWQSGELVPLDNKIVRALKLDDYINHYYKNGGYTVSLYISYYLTSKKVGAAHSPLVCFPGQGWQLSNFEEKSVTVDGETINLQRIIASTGRRKELLIYWFQSYDKTSSGTLVQKLNTLWSKFVSEKEDNAFVRVTVPMAGITDEEAYQIGVKFINAFYPRFLDYVKDDNGW
jgi:EpsI family protein